MTSSNVTDNIFDALFKQAIIDNFNDELDSYVPDSESIKQYMFTPEHERRIRALFAKEERKESLRNVMIWSKKIAAVLIIAISILFGSLMLVPEVRAVINETVIEWFDQFVRFSSNATDEEKTNLEPSYIPDGFEEDYRDGNEYITIIIYTNQDGVRIFFESQTVDAQLSVDNEGYEYEIKQFGTIDYHIFTAVVNDKENSIIWERSGQRYHLSSVVSVDQLLEIAFSIGK